MDGISFSERVLLPSSEERSFQAGNTCYILNNHENPFTTLHAGVHALESSKKAARLLQALKQSFPDWNPSWIASKLENASQIRERVELLAQKAPEPKKEDHSLKPGEWRDVTFERAYKAHEQQQLAVRQVPPAPVAAPVSVSSHAASQRIAPSGRRAEVRIVQPPASVVPRRAPEPTRVPPPRSDHGGRFRIGG